MDALVQKLDSKLKRWNPKTARAVKKQISEIMALADSDLLDLGRSRRVEQDVLDLIDEPKTR